MTDKELKNKIKKIGIIFIVICLFIVVLAIKVFASSKAELSICENSKYENDLRLLGIEEEELKKYLSIFATLLDKNKKDEILVLDCTTRFIDEMTSIYQEENENPKYDYEIINTVAKELKGSYIGKTTDYGNMYSYNVEEMYYIRNKELDKIFICEEIEDVKLNGDKIEVTYKIQNGENKIKATLMKNSEYEYSKYYLLNIEEQ